MSIRVFIPNDSTLTLIQSSNIFSVDDLQEVVWEKYLRLDRVKFSQVSLRTLVSYLQTYAFQLGPTPHGLTGESGSHETKGHPPQKGDGQRT
jgi:hypothetical protein